MTDDTHGSSPHDPEAEQNLEHEHEQTSTEAETWHGGAPEDDFKDPAHETHEVESEEGATVFEEPDVAPVETHESFDTEETIAEPTKKRSVLLPVVVTVGGILLLGVLAYWQFGDALHGDQPTPTVASQIVAPRVSLRQTGSKTASEQNTSTAVAPKTDMVPVTNVEPMGSTTVLPIQAQNVVLAPAPAPSPTTVVIQTAPAVPAVTTRAATAETDARIAALSTQVQDLQKALAEATAQLSQLSTKLSATPPAAPAAATQQSTLAIEERINGIEQKLMQIEHAPPAAPAPTTVVVASQAPVVEEPVLVTRTPHVTRHKTVHHKAPAKVRVSKPVANTHWVLRAASPEEAWVAKNSLTSDLQPVQVGDSLAGVGKITAIREQGGAWVIVGTKGTIR